MLYFFAKQVDWVKIFDSLYDIYSGGKNNPDLPIKSTENLNMTCRHCKRLVITPPPNVVLCLYSQLYEIALHFKSCVLNYTHF